MNAAVVICLDRNKLVEQESGPPVQYFYEVEATFTDTFNTTPLSYTSTIYVLPQIKPAE